MRTVMAKQRPLEEMPEWGKCCAASVAEKLRTKDLILEVSIGWAVRSFTCKPCGRFTDRVQVVTIVAPKFVAGAVIPISFFEFDEGLAEASHVGPLSQMS